MFVVLVGQEEEVIVLSSARGRIKGMRDSAKLDLDPSHFMRDLFAAKK